MTEGVRLVPITPLHAPVLAALHETGFDRPWPEEAFVQLLSDEVRLGVLAMERDTPSGFVMLQRAADEAEILTLVVAPPRRRAGIGKALLEWAIEWSNRSGLSRLILDVNEQNTAARSLYGSLGFAEIGQRSGYYPRGQGVETALVLALDFPSSVVQREPTR